VLTLLTGWIKSAVFEVQEYVRLQAATVRGVFSRPFYFHDVVEQFDLIGIPPTADELTTATTLLSSNAASENVQDLLWAIIMLPEFQLIR